MEPLRVLLVEDNEATRLLLRAYLERLKGVVVCGEAADGMEGRDLIWALKPDLVLLDLVMPVMDGAQLLRSLRDDPPPVCPQIIVLSHVTGDLAVQFITALGVEYYLTKPVNFSQVAELLGSMENKEPPVIGSQMESQARWLLLRMGAAENNLGCRYAALTAEQLALARPGELLLKEAYGPAIKEAGTSRANVEKNIRDLIDKLHRLGRDEYLTLMDGLPDRRPDNRTFLTRLADAIREK